MLESTSAVALNELNLINDIRTLLWNQISTHDAFIPQRPALGQLQLRRIAFPLPTFEAK
jgi:hypothetical protein